VTEARDENRVFFGEKRLRDWMQTRPAAESCAATCEALLDTIARFRGKAPQNDDIAVMCIKIL
jgi:serine phosphatase RsbU (regulator of sigma subunit)